MRRTSILVLLFALQPGFAQDALYHFTGEIETAGSDITPSGKFGALKVSFGVITPGGFCSWSGTLSDESGNRVDFESDTGQGPLPPGKSVLTLYFQGAEIARSRVDDSLMISALTLICSGKNFGELRTIEDLEPHLTGSFRWSDFDNPEPDFEFILPETPLRVAAGEIIWSIRLRWIGLMNEPIEIVTTATEPRLQLYSPQDTRVCSGASSCWREGQSFGFSARVPADLVPGTYLIQLVGRAAGKEHRVEFPFIVDAELTQRAHERASAIAALAQDDAVPPSPPAALPPASATLPESLVTFKAEVDLRKIHAVLVLDHSGSMAASCQFLLAAATRFSRLFVDARDWLGVISYGETVQLTLPLTDHFQTDAPDSISKIRCGGSTNTGEALEVAQQELTRNEDPEAINAVILFTDGLPNALTANWPVKARACNGRAGPQGGELRAILVTDYSGIYSPTSVRFMAADESPGTPTRNTNWNSCFGFNSLGNFDYIPEQDLHGVSLTGSHPLERFTDGPYAGRIRVDVRQNTVNAIANQMENVTQRLRSGPPNPTFVYVVGFANGSAPDALTSLDSLRQLANDPNGSSFDRNQPAGLAILTDTPEDFWPAFQRVRQDILVHATVR